MKAGLTLLFLITAVGLAFGQETADTTTQTIYKSGIGLGSVIAVVTSWDRNKSVLWAIFHGLVNWLYVIYFVLSRDTYDNQTEDESKKFRKPFLFKIHDDDYKIDKKSE